MARKVGDVAAQRGQRRAQLVRGVREEAALGIARALEAREHRVERCRQAPDLVPLHRLRQATARVARPLDVGRGARESLEWDERAAHQDGDGGAGQYRGAETRREEKPAEAGERLVEIVGRARNHDGAARGRSAHLGERSCVGA